MNKFLLILKSEQLELLEEVGDFDVIELNGKLITKKQLKEVEQALITARRIKEGLSC